MGRWRFEDDGWDVVFVIYLAFVSVSMNVMTDKPQIGKSCLASLPQFDSEAVRMLPRRDQLHMILATSVGFCVPANTEPYRAA